MAILVNDAAPCVLFEDEHLLVVHKPPGLNTHAPSPYAGEGIYDWLRHREPRWANLAIIHRLDKETSGVLVFSKSALANRSLTEQFTQRQVRKQYVLLARARPRRSSFTVVSALARAGNRYVCQPIAAGGERGETRFTVVQENPRGVLIRAEPITGKTHQIRVHASAHGFPILGDTLYGGAAAQRLMLHAQQIVFKHPATGADVSFEAAPDFETDPRLSLRSAVIDPATTNAYRLLHGTSDGCPGWYVDRLGDYLLSESESEPTAAQRAMLAGMLESFRLRGVYHKILKRAISPAAVENPSPKLLLGDPAPKFFQARENGVAFELSFDEGCSTGLFLDQRDNRRRLLTSHIAGGFPLWEDGLSGREVLNAFAYTCGFSVCAALAGARVTSLDLSKKHLEWGRRNFTANAIDPAGHDFIFGDAFEWFARLGKKGRRFDVIILDPPTFSRSRASGVFQAEKHYGKLVSAALPLLKSGGVLLASTNAARLAPEPFLETIHDAVRQAGRTVAQKQYVPQPLDFPVSRSEPAYLKTLWTRVA